MELLSKFKRSLPAKSKKKADGGPKESGEVNLPSATPDLTSPPTTAVPPPESAELSPITTVIAQVPHEQVLLSIPEPLNPTPVSAQPTPSEAPSSSPSHNIDPWARAYEILQKREPELMADYKKHLASLQDGATASADLSTPRSVESITKQLLEAREKKQWRVSLLGKEVKIREQAERLAKFLLWTDPIVKSAISTQPYAALAWSGVSLLLPLLTSGTTKNEAMLRGFNSIGDIQIYWEICEKTYLQSSHRQSYQDLIEPLAKLYSHVIEYQARVICHLSRAQLSRAWQDVAGWNDWDGKVTTIKDLSKGCSDWIPALQEEEIRERWSRQLQEMQESRTILDEIRRILEDGGKQTQKIYEDQKERDLLHDLASDYERGKNFNPRRVDGTCEWFFKDERFSKWRTSKGSALLWVSAGPSCGKSVLSRCLVDDGQLSTSVTASTVCYFFFKDGEEGRMDSADALSAILHQLFSRDMTGNLIGHAFSAHKSFGKSLSRNVSELWGILRDCAQSPDGGEIVCVLDALDECNEFSRRQLIDKLKDFYCQELQQNTSRLKFLITSRPYDDLEASFGKFSTAAYMRLDGDDKSDDIRHEINLVIDARLGELAGSLSLEDRRKISKRLKSMENRTYLWLHLTFGIIEQKRSMYGKRSKIEELLSDLPSQVSEAYEKILSRSQDETQTEILLRIVLAAARPLTLDETNVALTLALREERFASHAALESDLWPTDSFKTVVKNLCGLFISVYNAKLSFIHQTAREFLTAPESQNKWKGRLNMQDSHQTLSLCCLHHLLLPDFTTAIEDRQYPFFVYAATNWPFHFKSQGPDRADRSQRDARALCSVSEPQTRRWGRGYTLKRHPFYTWNPEEWTDLILASYLGLAQVVDDILALEHVDVNARGGWDYLTALEAATREGRLEVMQVLFNQSDEVKITEAVVRVAAENGKSGEAMMSLLLDKRGNEVKITDDVVKAAARNAESGEAVMSLLLDKRGNDVKITEGMVKGAVRLSMIGKEITMLLLDRRGINITAEAIAQIARSFDQQVVTLLLDRRGDEVEITQEVVEAAASNRIYGEEVMRLLLDRRGDEVKITEEVLKAAAGDRLGLMRLLLDRRGDEVKITEEVLKAAAGSGEEVMRLLLDRRGDEVKITEEVLKAAARGGTRVMRLLLDQRGDKVKITPEIVTAAASNRRYGQEMMMLLLDRRGDEVRITEEVVKAAASNFHSGEKVMRLLLDRRGDEVKITEEVVKAAASNFRSGEEVMRLLLDRRGDEIRSLKRQKGIQEMEQLGSSID